MNWLSANYKWLFDGVAGAIVVAFIAFVLHKLFGSKQPPLGINNNAAPNASPVINNSAKLEASPRIEQNVYVGGSPNAPIDPEPRRNETPRLTQLPAREVRLHQNDFGVWQEASSNLEGARRAIVLPFKNVPNPPGQQTPRAREVSASLVFRNSDASDEKHINHGVWLGYYEYSATFNSGVSHDLLIALKDVPFVTFENPNSYNPFHGGRFRPGRPGVIRHAQMKVVYEEGSVEIMLVDDDNVTVFRGMFDYHLSLETMQLLTRQSNSGQKVHYVPDSCNCGWARDDHRTDVRASGIFTYDGEGALTIVDMFLKGTKPKGSMMAQLVKDNRPGPVVQTFELPSRTPVKLLVNLCSEPIRAERGQPLRGQLVLRDNYNHEHEIDPVHFPWIGRV